MFYIFSPQSQSAGKSNFKRIWFVKMQRHRKKLISFKPAGSIYENLTIIMQLGLTMAGCIVFCLFIGLYMDKWLKTRGIFTTIFIILGIIGGANTVYRQILDITDDEPKKEDPPGK